MYISPADYRSDFALRRYLPFPFIHHHLAASRSPPPRTSFKMLLKFTSHNIENTSIIDCSTGEVAYVVLTPVPASRTRSRSTSSLMSFASSSSSSQDRYTPEQKVTSLLSADGETLAEIFWEERHASVIKIGEETLAGTGELFDAQFVKVLRDETLIPTRMEYIWRTTPDELTLLDDDEEVIGRLYSDCSSDDLAPALRAGSGCDYFEMDERPLDEMPEILVTYLLMHTLRDRMYSITKYVYGQQQNLTVPSQPYGPLNRLRRKATRSFAALRESFRRSGTS